MNQGKKEKVVFVVPAYNEEGYVKPVLETAVKAKKAGVIDEILVVDGDSTDRTREEVADVLGDKTLGHLDWLEKEGAHHKDPATGQPLREVIPDSGNVKYRLKEGMLIRHRHNWGKARAFVTAARFCHRHGADIMLMCDADMHNLSVDDMKGLLETIRGKPDVWMSRAGYRQVVDGWSKDQHCPPDLSGFRAIRDTVWAPIIRLGERFGEGGINREHLKDLRLHGPRNTSLEKYLEYFPTLDPEAPVQTHGFHLERSLEYLVPKKHTDVAILPNLTSRRRGGGHYPMEHIDLGINYARKVKDERDKDADRIWILKELRRRGDTQLVNGKPLAEFTVTDIADVVETHNFDRFHGILKGSKTSYGKKLAELWELKKDYPDEPVVDKKRWRGLGSTIRGGSTVIRGGDDAVLRNGATLGDTSYRQVRRLADLLPEEEVDKLSRELKKNPPKKTPRSRRRERN